MSQTPDLVTMARFLVLPGAGELLAAFASIPPGKLRDSAVLHVQAIAETYADAPAEQHMPDPLLMAAQGGFGGGRQAMADAPVITPVQALTGPRRGTPKTDDPEVKAIELALRGMPPHLIAEELSLSIKTVMSAKKAARAAGLIFPKAAKGKAAKGQRKTKFAKRFAMTIAEFDPRGLGVASAAAERRGLDVETYIERRALAVTMAMEGRHMQAIMHETKESETGIRTWLNSARAAGLSVPYMAMSSFARAPEIEAEVVEPEPAPEPANVVKLRPTPVPKSRSAHNNSFILTPDQLTPGNRVAIERGAALMGLSAEAYLQKRVEVVGLYQRGKLPTEVAQVAGITRKQAANWRARAADAGVLGIPIRPRRAL